MIKNDDNLFYLCSFIEYVARETSNTKKYVVTSLGYDNLKKIYDFADIYHCEDIEKIKDEYVNISSIKKGNYNLVLNDGKPTYFDIGKVYQRLILMLDENRDLIDRVYEVFTSWFIPHLDNYNSSLYYENPSYIYACYIEKKILE